eukprot:571631_1
MTNEQISVEHSCFRECKKSMPRTHTNQRRFASSLVNISINCVTVLLPTANKGLRFVFPAYKCKYPISLNTMIHIFYPILQSWLLLCCKKCDESLTALHGLNQMQHIQF